MWGGVASIGILWMQQYSLLTSTSSSSHMVSSNPAVGRYSSSSPESAASGGGGVSLKVSYQLVTPSQNGRSLGCLGVKGKSWLWAVVWSTGLKEASAENME